MVMLLFFLALTETTFHMVTRIVNENQSEIVCDSLEQDARIQSCECGPKKIVNRERESVNVVTGGGSTTGSSKLSHCPQHMMTESDMSCCE